MIRTAAMLALAGTAACGRPSGEGDRASTPPEAPSVARTNGGLATRDCRRTEGDSAQAVCLAENEIERVTSEYAEAYGIERHGDTICVHTWPDRRRDPAGVIGVDGEGAVEVAGGKVIASLTGDSVPCPRDAARVHAAHWGTKENDVD